jgi:hypothetical protein
MTDKPIISLLDDRDIQWCKVRGCPHVRASHFVAWPTATGASGAYRCRAHARAFAVKHSLEYPRAPGES